MFADLQKSFFKDQTRLSRSLFFQCKLLWVAFVVLFGLRSLAAIALHTNEQISVRSTLASDLALAQAIECELQDLAAGETYIRFSYDLRDGSYDQTKELQPLSARVSDRIKASDTREIVLEIRNSLDENNNVKTWRMYTPQTLQPGQVLSRAKTEFSASGSTLWLTCIVQPR